MTTDMSLKPSWYEYFREIARVVSSRASCPRASCGVVIVRDNRILSTGYNGAPSGKSECVEVGCQLVNDHCIRAAHGEQNAIGYAAKNGVSLEGATMYIWFEARESKGEGPCHACGLLIQSSGIKEVTMF